LKPKEAAAEMRDLDFRPAEIDAVAKLVPDAQKIVQIMKGRKTGTPKEAYTYIASLPAEMIAFIEVEMPVAAATSKFKNYFQKWRPLRQALPTNELDALGFPRGPEFDKVMEQVFDMQLRGRAKTPEERVKILRQLAGIKEELPKKAEKEKRKKKGEEAAKPAAIPGKVGGASAAPLKHLPMPAGKQAPAPVVKNPPAPPLKGKVGPAKKSGSR
jgi:hypothetical protein